jgi:hypothetical protein
MLHAASPGSGGDNSWAEAAQLRQQVAEQDEQLEQSAKVIRYLQLQLQQAPAGGSAAGTPTAAASGGAGGSGGRAKEQLLMEQLEATQDECDELRGQVGVHGCRREARGQVRGLCNALFQLLWEGS